MTAPPRWTCLVAAAALAVTAACASPESATGEPSVRIPTEAPEAPPAQPVSAEVVSQARTRLAALAVQPRHVPSDYTRAAFGESWVDIDGNGCNQRDDVLLRDAKPGTTKVQRQGSCAHDVLAGTWGDPYTGRTLTFADLKDLSQAQAIQIDHIVPLAEAWVSGADTWTPQRREKFANTLGVLLAVGGPTNASKGASDPAAWRPRKGFQCRYAIRWIGIKTIWGLAADPSEVRALWESLELCKRDRG